MNRKKKVIISIISVLLLIIIVGAATYAYIVAITNEGNASTGSGMLDINYGEPDDISGSFTPSADRSGGLRTSATASLKDGSVDAILNMYITPTALTNLNIPALKWEAEGVRNGEVICSGSGDFSNAVVGEPIKLFVNDVTDNVNDCTLSTTETTFNIYIWLDVDLIDTSLSGVSFGATIGADSVDITGLFDKLPSEYQQVEYLESTGTQYIDLKYAYKINDEINIQFMKTQDTGAIQGVFGNGNLSPYIGTVLYINGENILTSTIGGILGTNFYKYETAISNNIKYDIKYQGNNVYLDDKLIISVSNVLQDGTQEDFSLFRRWGTNGMYGRIYNFSVKRNNQLIFNFIPCYRKSDGVIGMYDLVENKFYTNSGTGEFTKGNDV